MWASIRAWLETGAIPDDPELKAELTGREYGFDLHNAIRLEKKEDMKKRGLSSPDNADGLCLTFAYPVADLPEDARFEGGGKGQGGSGGPNTIQSDYDPHGEPLERPVTLDSHRLQCQGQTNRPQRRQGGILGDRFDRPAPMSGGPPFPSSPIERRAFSRSYV